MFMKNFWIVVGIIVLVGLVYFIGKSLFSSPDTDIGSTAGNLEQSVAPESTSAPSVVATESPTNSPTPSSSPAPTSVSLINMSFQPAELTVKVGDTVTFTNNDTVAHNVTFSSFSSKLLQPGDNFAHIFKTKGTYGYKCTIHPKVMAGTVIVN